MTYLNTYLHENKILLHSKDKIYQFTPEIFYANKALYLLFISGKRTYTKHKISFGLNSKIVLQNVLLPKLQVESAHLICLGWECFLSGCYGKVTRNSHSCFILCSSEIHCIKLLMAAHNPGSRFSGIKGGRFIAMSKGVRLQNLENSVQ